MSIFEEYGAFNVFTQKKFMSKCIDFMLNISAYLTFLYLIMKVKKTGVLYLEYL